MKTYFCVMSEYYNHGAVKAAVISRACEEKPKDSVRDFPCRLTAFMDWFESLELAEAHRASCLTGRRIL